MIDNFIIYLSKIPPTDMIFTLLLMCVFLALTSSVYRRKAPNSGDLFNIASIPLTIYSFITIVILAGDLSKISGELVVPIYWALSVHIYICIAQIIAVYSKASKRD